MNFEPMYDGALVTCSELVWQLGRSRRCERIVLAGNSKLGESFDHVITTQQAGCYKPCMKMFKLAEDRIGVDREHRLHVGQSIYHDVIPAQSLGIATVWVNRRSPRPGAGAAKAAAGNPDLEVPDLQTLAKLAA
jgi:2-haloacid dehalogenase